MADTQDTTRDTTTPTVLRFEDADITVIGDTPGGEPVFVAAPIARKLGHRDAADMLRGLDDDEKGTHIVRTLGGPQEMGVITLPGLSHALNNRRPGSIRDPQTRAMVIRFQRWVNHEVIPAIGRHGMYATDGFVERALADPDSMIRVLTRLKEERAARARAEATVREQAGRLAEQAPKVLFADSVATSTTSVLVGDFAKDLRQNGVRMGQNRLFAWLRRHGYLCSRRGESWNQPTQWAMEHGWFEVRTRVIDRPDGSTMTVRTTKVTGKGRIHLTGVLMGAEEAR